MDLIFASHNENKVKEIRAVLPSFIQLFSLTDIGYISEIEENGFTLEENAKIKAETIFKKTRKNVFADDTGFFVESLDGAPGIYSARYAGTGNSTDNIQKVLKKLHGIENRKAYFKTVICLIWNQEIHFLSGEIHGEIIQNLRGNDGFGYDPIFIPDGFTKTFAEMDLEEKNRISHRSLAVKKLINFVENI